MINSEIFTIKSIDVIGANKTSAVQIESLVSSAIDFSKFGIFSRRNFLFIDTQNINEAISKAFPDFSKVRTTLAGLGSLVVEVVERSPYAKWCDESSNSECLIIDNQGFAFESSSQSRATTFLSIFTQSKPVYASEIFDADRFSKLKQIIDSFDKSGYVVVSVTETDADYFLEISNGFEVRIKSDDESSDIIAKLDAIQNDLKNGGNTAPIDYIDLRYGNKVFLKRQ